MNQGPAGFWLLLAAGAGWAGALYLENRGLAAMPNGPNDPFFNRITLQLIDAPAPSKKALEEAAAGVRRPVPPQAEFPVVQAKSWVRQVLKPEYHPRQEPVFVAFPEENGVCDAVRGAYRVENLDFEIAQSIHLLSIKVRGLQLQPGLPPQQAAEAAARRLFTMDNRIRFQMLGPFRKGSCGLQDPALEKRVDPNWPHWLDLLRWWTEGNEIGFVTLKAAGGPTKAPISPTESMNVKWFE